MWLLRHAFLEARPVVQLVFLLRFSAGALLGAEELAAVVELSVFLAAASWFATTWAIYLLNGVADIVEDRTNGSTRPIARGDLPIDAAAAIVWLLAAFGLVAALIVSTGMAVLVTLMLFVGFSYSVGSRPLKRSMTGFVVSVTALGLLTYLAGWHASGEAGLRDSLLLFGIMMSLWMGLGGSTKDLSDTRGDRLAGRRTLPVMLGERRARMVMAGAATFVGWVFVILAVAWVRHLLPIAFVVCTGSVVLAIVALTMTNSADRSAKRRPYRVFMITQYLAHGALLALFA